MQVGCGGGIVNRDAIVVGIQRFDEVGVELIVEEGDFRAGFWKRRTLRDDGSAKVEVDEACGRELGLAIWKGGCEGALMVIVSICWGIVLAADIDDCMAGGEERRIPSAQESGRIIGGEET